ncbi:hypothetical protein [Poriferisphaera sp. WC338]|uniref:hypothetical protein n=1 Tax=Poriferisphaera sp. WC338 TaxID=3425129 RepID=UPI003D81C4E4
MPPRSKQKPLTQKILPKRTRLKLAHLFTLIIFALQTWLLLTLYFTTSDPPPRLHLFELIWALMHRPAFYPLVILILAAPPLTFIAFKIRPRTPIYHPRNHRTWLFIIWATTFSVLFIYFPHRIDLMLRILAGQYLST